MNELKIFNNPDFGEIRIITEDGKTLFCAYDIATQLGYSNPRKAVADHCRCVTKRDVPHPQSFAKKIEMNFINEADLYRLIVASTLPSAEKFEMWVFEEVLPSIRQNGGYIANQENLTPEQIVANALIVAQNIILQKDKLLEEQRPKVLFAEAWEVSDKSILVGEMAKLLARNGLKEMGQNRFFEWLRSKGYLHKNGEQYNLPTQKSIDLEIVEIKTTTITNTDGSVRVTKTPKITVKGQQYFINKFLD